MAELRATLEEVNEADLLLHVIDASHPNWEEQREVVDQVLAELGAGEKPVLYVFSKIDALPDADLEALRQRISNLIPKSVFVSAVSADGIDPLRRALLSAGRQGMQVAEIRFSSGDGRLLAQVHREASVIDQRTENGELVLNARIADDLAARLRRAGASLR